MINFNFKPSRHFSLPNISYLFAFFHQKREKSQKIAKLTFSEKKVATTNTKNDNSSYLLIFFPEVLPLRADVAQGQ